MAYKRLTASGAIGSDGQQLKIFHTELLAGSDAATAKIADQDTAGGDSLIHLNAGSAGAVDRAAHVNGFPISDGGYVTLTGTDPVCVVEYEPVKGQ